MMAHPTKLTVLLAKAEPISLSASPSHLKTGKLENNLRLFGKLCPQSYLNSFQKEMMQAPSLSLHSTPVLKFSASKIEVTVMKNLCSNLPLLEAHSCLHLLHLTYGHLSCQYRQCVMAAPLPPCFFAAWRVEAPFSAVSLSHESYTLGFL